MKHFDHYLDDLQHELSSLSQDEREAILAEIESHIEAGLADAQLGPDEAARLTRLRAELGQSTLLAQGLLLMRRRRLWGTAVLILGLYWFVRAFPPLFLVQESRELLQVLATVFALVYFGGVIGTLIISGRRHLPAVTGWWLGVIISDFGLTRLVVPYLLRQASQDLPQRGGVGGMDVVFVGLVVIAVLFYGRLLWRWRHDGIWLTFAILPLILSLSNVTFRLLYLFRPHYFDSLDYDVIETGLQVLASGGIVFFFLWPRQRWVRWLGMGGAFVGYLMGVAYLVFSVPQAYYGSSTPLFYLVSLWVLFISVSLAGIWVDKRSTSVQVLGSL